MSLGIAATASSWQVGLWREDYILQKPAPSIYLMVQYIPATVYVVWWLSGQEETDVLLKKTGNIKDEIKKNANILHRLLACLTELIKGSTQDKGSFEKTISVQIEIQYL